MTNIVNYFKSLNLIKNTILKIKNDSRVEISEATIESTSLILSCYFSESKEDIFVICPNNYQAQRMYDILSKTVDNCYFYPKDDFISIELLTESFDFKLERINTLKAIFLDKSKKIIIAPLSSVLTKCPLKDTYYNKIINLSKNTTIKPKELIDKLVSSSYERVFTVEKQGECSLRGSIVDIFPINEDTAYRIDFFGDTIETIKLLDVETQRSGTEKELVVVMPKSEILFSDDEKEAIRFYINDKLTLNLSDKTKERFLNDLDYLEKSEEHLLLSKYFFLFNKENYSILDYLDNKTVIYYDYQSIIKQEAITNEQIYEYLSSFREYFTVESFLNKLSYYNFDKEVYFTKTKQINTLDEIIIHSKEVTDYSNDLNLLKGDLLTSYKDKTIILSLDDRGYDVIKDYFDINEVKYNLDSIKENEINIIKGYFPKLDIEDIKILVLNSEAIFRQATYKKSSKYKLSVETKRLKSISELKIGDYVVHQDYGIGKFLEIKTITFKNKTNDYIHIKYDKEQSVYIPVENLHVLSKYAGSEESKVKLSSLNTKEWEHTKKETRKRCTELAQRLLNLYTIRENGQGFKYFCDDDVQKEFEDDFNYELTDDQITAINECKEDMQSDRLMDRLICGDVGFGKTEVALRCAFKAVLSGKQVAYLCPTTILARQHYYTFKERMEKFGVQVGVVSRFVDQRRINDYLLRLKSGALDIIIGTHRLLSKDIVFKNLGLLIIDEEQRFGVEAKESIKELKNNIDVLTLTATPIPRTLQMAITGIKNVSLIETAPKGRYPVQTYVLERNDYVIKDAIEKEVSKGGQVFFLYNRVEDMDKIVSYVHSLVPEIRLSVIHGKMDKNEIEDTISSFINRESDVLISTTIIETGVDIPNANTLIVYDSDRYGLSQLYQIKGRVGRADKISYAYLMYDKNKTLTEDAQKRLQAIKDFAELGSGFKIAVRDLTTRGAGEILGHDQSGFMDKVGVDLYLKMLDEEVKKLKGEEKTEKPQDIRMLMSRHIDKDYINDDYMIIEVHNRISKLKTISELEDLYLELTDRFSKPSDSLYEYMYTKLSENLINDIGFERCELSDSNVLLVVSTEKTLKSNPELLFKYASLISKNFFFYYKVKKIFIEYTKKSSSLLMYKDLSKFLESIKNDQLL